MKKKENVRVTNGFSNPKTEQPSDQAVFWIGAAVFSDRSRGNFLRAKLKIPAR